VLIAWPGRVAGHLTIGLASLAIPLSAVPRPSLRPLASQEPPGPRLKHALLTARSRPSSGQPGLESRLKQVEQDRRHGDEMRHHRSRIRNSRQRPIAAVVVPRVPSSLPDRHDGAGRLALPTSTQAPSRNRLRRDAVSLHVRHWRKIRTALR